MEKRKRKILEGRINLVQEERFRLATDRGNAYLLSLAHDSRTTGDDLRQWYRSGIRIRVEYEGEPDFESGVAHRVRPLTTP